METEGSITRWLGELKDGDEREAQEQIWNRYFQRLMGLARKKLADMPRRAVDEEDVVLSALDSFFRGVREGRYPRLNDRNNLWALLSKITAHKAVNERLWQIAEKRGGGKVRGESIGVAPGADTQIGLLAEFPDKELTPSFLAMMQEQCHRLLDKLGDPTLRRIAEMKLAGHTNTEIADLLDVVERTVERKLRLIRERWSEENRSPV